MAERAGPELFGFYRRQGRQRSLSRRCLSLVTSAPTSIGEFEFAGADDGEGGFGFAFEGVEGRGREFEEFGGASGDGFEVGKLGLEGKEKLSLGLVFARGVADGVVLAEFAHELEFAAQRDVALG